MNTEISAMFQSLLARGVNATTEQKAAVARLQSSGWQVVGVAMFNSSLPSLAVAAVSPQSKPCKSIALQATLDSTGYPIVEQYSINGTIFKELTATRGINKHRTLYIFDCTSTVSRVLAYEENGDGANRQIVVHNQISLDEISKFINIHIDAFPSIDRDPIAYGRG